MGWEAWFTVCLVAVCFYFMARNRPPDVVLLGGLTLLLVTGIITPAQALAGLSNEGVITVAILYVVVAGLKETGGIGWIVQSVLGRPRSLQVAQIRLMAPVAAMSAFLNNTPVVAMFIPAVTDWAKKNSLSTAKLMMPLSYAAIVGGTCTLIGTSTNLVVNGLLIEQGNGDAGLGLFDLAWVGVPVTLITIGFVLVFSRWLLPERRSAGSQFADVRKYTVEMMVEPNSPLVNKSVEEAGLRALPGMYLIEIDRDGYIMPAVSPHEVLRGNDRLVFAGVVDSVVDLQRIRGLQPATDQVFKLDSPREDRSLVEAVVSQACPLVGKSIREGRFRTVYNAAVIAVARDGVQLNQKLGDIVLEPGDTLLLEAHPEFVTQQRNSRDFYLVSRLEDSSPLRHDKATVAIIILAVMVLSVATGLLSMLKAAMLAAGAMILTRCVSSRTARRSVDWQVIIVIAASFGIGKALEVTGAAHALAGGLVAMVGGMPWLALAMVFAATALLTALVTNNTAAVLMFPIALAASRGLDVDFLPFAITIMIAASASFATPIGYQTNLMVYGPGGYQFMDYIRMGIPLTAVVGVVTLLVVPLVWGF